MGLIPALTVSNICLSQAIVMLSTSWELHYHALIGVTSIKAWQEKWLVRNSNWVFKICLCLLLNDENLV